MSKAKKTKLKYNMHVKYSAFESFLLELELSYDVLEELADKCAEHGLRIEYPVFKGNFGTFEAMDLIVYKSDNYVLQQVYQTAKKDPSVVVEDPAYAGGEAEGRDNARNDKRLSGFRGRRKEQLRQKKKPISKVFVSGSAATYREEAASGDFQKIEGPAEGTRKA